MMFEVQDLKVASPATVSRCGMVYMEQIHIGIISLVKSWSSTVLSNFITRAAAKFIVSTIEANLEVAINFIHTECIEMVSTSNNQLTISFLNLFMSKLSNCEDPELIVQDSELINALVLWCFIWSLGANIYDTSRLKFHEWCRGRFSTTISSKYSMILHDPYGTLLDMTTHEVKPWSSIMSNYEYNINTSYFSILIPTIDTTRYRYLLDKLITNNHNVLLMGQTGVGKSVIINSFLNDITKQNNSKYVSYSFGYSAQTKPSNLRDIFETKLDKKRKNLLGPPAGKRMIFFIDDINMPALETYGSQPPNELLRQIIDQNGFYDTNKLFFKYINDTNFVSACCPPGKLCYVLI